MVEAPLLEDILAELDDEIELIIHLLSDGKASSELEAHHQIVKQLLEKVSKYSAQNRDLCSRMLSSIAEKLVDLESAMLTVYTELQQMSSLSLARATKAYKGR